MNRALSHRRVVATGGLLLLLGAACHPGGLGDVSGALVFSSPDQPAAVQQPDAGLVEIAFGDVAVNASKTLTLSFESNSGAGVTLDMLTATQPDAEFSLPLPAGALVQSTPSQVTVGFAPTSLGDKAAAFLLTYVPSQGAAIVFRLTGVGVANGLDVVPNPVDFGNVEVNQSQTVSVTLTNASQLPASLVLSAPQGQDSQLFRLGVPSTLSLAPSASATVNATFAPLATGPASAFFTVDGWATSPPVTVNLAGTGVQSWLKAVSPLDFGFVQLGGTVLKSATVTNIGSFSTLHVTLPAPLINQTASTYRLGSVPPLPLAIAPGQSVSLPVSFTPTALDLFTGALLLSSDDPQSPNIAVQLEGYGGGPRLYCVPQVTFGPVVVGFSASLPAICVNSGTDIPSHPEIGLQISQSDLATDSSAFSASLTLADGGLAGPDFGVSLAASQSISIQVAFHPMDAGLYENRLIVGSNDLNDPDAGTILSGQGIAPGPCQLEVTPADVAFGEVPVGNSGLLQLELTNIGHDFCIFSHAAIDPSSDPAFSLPGGDPGYHLLSFAGNLDNPVGLPTSLRLDVQFAPTIPETLAQGTLDLAGGATSAPLQTVPLTASSQPGCLRIEPPSHDFGVVGFSVTRQQICAPDKATFLAQNICAGPVTVTRIATRGIDVPPQFALESGQGLPVVITSGSQIAFAASFDPTTLGPKVGAVAVTSDEFPGSPYLVTLQGDAEVLGHQTDTFIVPPPPKQLDLLWVLDNDDDLDQVQTISALLSELIDTMNQAQIDYQIAVTSTDTCDGGDQGFFEPCDHCVSTASVAPLFVTPMTSDAGATLASLFGQFDLQPWFGYCQTINGDEHFFDAIADAFSPNLLSGHNSGFLRPGAYLAIIVVNGDAEDDAAGLLSEPPGSYLTSLAQVTTLVEDLKTDPSQVSVSYINSGAGALGVGQEIGQLVEATGGVGIDTTTPVSLWQAELLDLFAFSTGPEAFYLSMPANPSGAIQVDVDGQPAMAWTYDPFGNQIVFAPGQLPAPGSVVTVTYQVNCS